MSLLFLVAYASAGGTPREVLDLDASEPAEERDEGATERGPELVIGSYGRVDVGVGAGGGAGEPIILTAHPGRLWDDPYLELDLGSNLRPKGGPTFTALVTPALSGPLFHYDGTFDSALAIRNLYVDADGVWAKPFGVWAGSRMYRGDDVYLLDFWPLDSLNMVGGGVRWQDADTFIGLSAGVNRLADGDWEVQSIEITTPGAVAGQSVTVLDRQQTELSLKASRVLHVGTLSLRPKLYGELHSLPAGVRYHDEHIDVSTLEALPEQHGWLIGGELSAWGWGESSFVHLFYRHATGLAAIGELTVPTTGFALDGTLDASSEDLAALSFNQQGRHYSVTAAGYLRAWADADGNAIDFEDGTEYTLALRPAVYFARYGALQLELDHQFRRPNGLNPTTNAWDVPQATSLSVMPAIQLRPGAFARPQIHLRYTATLLNQDAQDWYPEYDTRGKSPIQHQFGVGAEWWVNSQGYR